MKFVVTTAMFLASLAGLATAADPRPEAKLVGVRKIWDQAPHNAFTDLIRFKDRWFCVFREGQTHVSPDGSLRVIASADGEEWMSAALLTSETADLRDAKINQLPDGRLMLSGAAAWHKPKPATHQTLAWFSENGQKWTEPVEIGEPDFWLWRTAWHQRKGYGVGYGVNKANRRVRLYASDDGRVWNTLVGDLFDRDYPNESALLFNYDGSCLCLLRRDAASRTAQLGHASPPYTQWQWRDLGVPVGGPSMIRLPSGQIVAVTRLYDKKTRTSLSWLDPDAGKLTEFLALPSGGDTSYAGLVWHDELLWISYYSSHEGKTNIYLAKVKFGD